MRMHEFIQRLFASLSFVAIGALLSCGGTLVHRDLHENDEVFRRSWVFDRSDIGSKARVGPNIGHARVGIEYSTVQVSDGALFFGLSQLGLLSLYPDVRTPRFHILAQIGVNNPITLTEELILAVAEDGFLYSAAQSDGQIKWRANLKTNIASQPVVLEGRVYVVTGDDAIYCYELNQGQLLWNAKRRSLPSIRVRDVAKPLVTDVAVIAGFSDGYIASYGKEDGRLKAEKKLAEHQKYTDIDTSPVSIGDDFLVSAYDGSLFRLRKNDLGIVWKRDQLGGSKSLMINGPNVFIPTSHRTLVSLNYETAVQNWTTELDKGNATEVLLLGDQLWFASSQQYIYVANAQSGKLLARMDAGSGSGFSHGFTWDNARKEMIAISHGGRIYAFRPTSLPHSHAKITSDK